MSSKVLHSLELNGRRAPVSQNTHWYPTHPSLVGASAIAKRTLDIVGSVLGLFLLAPIFVLVAIAIKVDSPGPVIFKQIRVGINGTEFEIYKFRSMVIEAEALKDQLWDRNEIKDGPIFKIARDPRITRVGRFLRRTSLDEFPQLINVLLGQMSLVGPRPPLPSEVQQYSANHWQRLTVTPGATGLWQVSGRSDLTSFEMMVGLDLDYIRNWSLWKDVCILFKTIKVVFKMEGSC